MLGLSTDTKTYVRVRTGNVQTNEAPQSGQRPVEPTNQANRIIEETSAAAAARACLGKQREQLVVV